MGVRDRVGRAGERVSELPPRCVVRLRLRCAAPVGRDASQVLTDRADVRTQGGSLCCQVSAVRDAVGCGVTPEAATWHVICVSLSCFVCVPDRPSSSPNPAI